MAKCSQDSYFIETSLGGNEYCTLFGVLDGHGGNGNFVSQFCRDQILLHIGGDNDILMNDDDPSEMMYDILMRTDKMMHLTDDILCQKSGTTASIMIINSRVNKIWTFNIGDSRTTLGTRMGKPKLGKNGREKRKCDVSF